MEIVDYEHAAWFLLRKEQALFLDVHCSHGAVDYGFSMQLNDEETQRWKNGGHATLTKLAAEIQNSAPGVLGTRSPYKDRNLDQTMGSEISAAISRFRQKR